jgi:hypothetical protein
MGQTSPPLKEGPSAPDPKGPTVEEEIGKRLVQAIKNPADLQSQESIAKAMELTKAYAASGSATHFSTVTKLFFDLFEMFETGKDPRVK